MPRGRKYEIILTEADRERIQQTLDDESSSITKRNRANILLMSADGESSKQIINNLEVSGTTVARVRQQFNEHGIDAVLNIQTQGGTLGRRSPGSGGPNKISDEVADEADKLHNEGSTFRDLAEKFDRSPEGIRKAIVRRQNEKRER